ncbi:MAG: hypothetical protein O3A87_03955 [Verrucomicrobia bacterium]|nr:hypothetical protein [Verrucomicrobiota bacterium]MDA1005618.1 hypothetical protein [Verrucomicrobiota bacterium]
MSAIRHIKHSTTYSFTGFCSEMNNMVRLQGRAHSDNILCMKRFVDAPGPPEPFGEADALADPKAVLVMSVGRP